MSTIRVTIDTKHLQADPGQPVTIDVGIYNAGRIVDEVMVTVLGLEPAWVSYEPNRLSLLPDTSGRIRITVAIPPGAPITEGRRVLGIKVTSVGESGSSVVEELALDVGRVSEATIHAEPQLVRGGRSAKFRVEIDNRGNHPLDLDLDGSDPERAVALRFSPQRLRVPPHGPGHARVVASARRPFTGAETQRPLTVEARGGGAELTTRVTFSQRPWISRGVLMAVPLLLILGGVGLAAACGLGYCGSDDDPVDAAQEISVEDGNDEPDDGGGDAEEPDEEEPDEEESGDDGDDDEEEPPPPEPRTWERELQIRPFTATYAFRTDEPGRIHAIAEWETTGRVLGLSLTGPPDAPAQAATADDGIVEVEHDVPEGDHDPEDEWLLELTDSGVAGSGGGGFAPAPVNFVGELDVSYPSPPEEGFFEHPFTVPVSSGSSTTVLTITEPGDLAATVSWPDDATVTLLGPERDEVYATASGSEDDDITLSYEITDEDVSDGSVWFVVIEADEDDSGTLDVRYPPR